LSCKGTLIKLEIGLFSCLPGFAAHAQGKVVYLLKTPYRDGPRLGCAESRNTGDDAADSDNLLARTRSGVLGWQYAGKPARAIGESGLWYLGLHLRTLFRRTRRMRSGQTRVPIATEPGDTPRTVLRLALRVYRWPGTVSNVGTHDKPNRPAVASDAVLVAGGLVVDAGELVLDAAPDRAKRRPVATR
jgi:hypothetical protein